MKMIGVVGSRRRATPADFVMVRRAVLALYEPGDGIVSGGCQTGADAFAERIAAELCVTPTIHRPDYAASGRIAPFLRNDLVARDSDVLVACVAPARTGGTEDTIRKFTQKYRKTALILV